MSDTRVIAVNGPPDEDGSDDITDDVKLVLDALHASMDWGSGFLDDETTDAAERLMATLEFECQSNYDGEQTHWYSSGYWLPAGSPGPFQSPSVYDTYVESAMVPVNAERSPDREWRPIYRQEVCRKTRGHTGKHGP